MQPNIPNNLKHNSTYVLVAQSAGVVEYTDCTSAEE